MRILLKIGGAQLENTAPRQALAQAIARARTEGHELVVVHGGGNQIRTLGKALGIAEQYHDGLRVTDARTAEVVLMVLAGLVNKTLVRSLQRCRVPAVGLCGADGGTFTAQKLSKPGADLGFVGAIDLVDPHLVQTLLSTGQVPVIATVAPGTTGADDEPFFNLNADHAAGPLCRALHCDALLFLTDVPGVLDAQGQRLPRLTPTDCERLVATGVAKGGMLPKLDAALAALRDNPRALIKIAPANAPDAVLAALRANSGTAFTTTTTAAADLET
ncbi:MAG: acetylglutamate kinase [Planctomycetota bacterium]